MEGLRTDNRKNSEIWTDASSKTCRCNVDDDMARCNTQANDIAKTANNWKTPGTMVLGRYNVAIWVVVEVVTGAA